jgi:hypothetical protein
MLRARDVLARVFGAERVNLAAKHGRSFDDLTDDEQAQHVDALREILAGVDHDDRRAKLLRDFADTHDLTDDAVAKLADLTKSGVLSAPRGDLFHDADAVNALERDIAARQRIEHELRQRKGVK